MSDQSFGKASRDTWDDRERLDEHRRQFERNEVRDRINLRTFPSHARPGETWYAVDDDTWDGPESVIGWGSTEQEAIDDLIDKILERSK